MKKTYWIGLIPFFILFFTACEPESPSEDLYNAEQTLRLSLGMDNEGRPFYQLFHRDQLVLDTSFLGLQLEGLDLTRGLQLSEVQPPRSISEEYDMLHGKKSRISYTAQQYVVIYQNDEGLPLECHFNLSENGLAYRYRLSEAHQSPLKILSEQSTFGFSPSARAWMQPMSKAKSGWRETNPSYEEHYEMEIPVTRRSPIGEGYVFPALFKTDSTWLLISETNLHRNYCGSRLQYDDIFKSLRVTFPQEAEIFPGGELLPNGEAPFTTPWRTIALGGLGDIVVNTLGTDLAAPAIDLDTGFIRSGLASWSWVLLKDNFTNYETSRRFIDYASKMNWPYCLIDADWDQKIGYEKMQELIDYANTKNVGILLWYNSSGDWNSTIYTPKSKLVEAEGRKAEFARLQQMGVAGIKVDFFGGDGQSMIAYYHDILRDAAEHELMLNFHGATLPRGWHRTYPNLMTVEAIKGGEFITFEQINADRQPSHCTVIPFTRNVYDPMDFTPMVLDSIPNMIRRTTTSFELALPVLFTSGIQHMAEIPEGMDQMPDYIVDYLRDIPTRWDETRLISGYPGKDVVMARRKGDTWHIVGINGEAQPKSLEIDFSFVQKKEGLFFFDGKTDIPEMETIDANVQKIEVKPYGGFVIKI